MRPGQPPRPKPGRTNLPRIATKDQCPTCNAQVLTFRSATEAPYYLDPCPAWIGGSSGDPRVGMGLLLHDCSAVMNSGDRVGDLQEMLD